MQQSVFNIKKKLPDFVVRFYLDSSIFYLLQSMAMAKKPTSNLSSFILNLQHIIKSPNSEIFIYFCEEIVLGKKKLERTRTYRYIPLFEPDVNVCICREADGIVSMVDCHNIKIFSQNEFHSLALIYQFGSDYSHSFKVLDKIMDDNSETDLNPKDISHYADWLILYDELFMKPYHHTFSFVDILAGVFGMKIKFNETYRNRIIDKVTRILADEDSLSCLLNEKYPTIESRKGLHRLYMEERSHMLIPDELFIPGAQKMLNIGYDEIILLELFAPILRINYDSSLKKNLLKPVIENKLKLLTLIHKNKKFDKMYKDIKEEFKNFSYEHENIKNENSKDIAWYGTHQEIICEVRELFDIKKEISTNINIKKYIELMFQKNDLKEKYKNNFFNYNMDIINLPFREVKYIYESFYYKYLKYKMKYLQLQNNI